MILIADSGSTKCDWILYENASSEPLRIKTKGLNPAILNKKQFIKIIADNQDLKTYKNDITQIKFFGAGCGSKRSQKKVNSILKLYFENAEVITNEDTMAAIMATTKTPAVVCILGTGSNCCYFDGKHIHLKTPSFGYILMDEGSGNYFGKLLLQSYFYERMPSDLRSIFESTFNVKEKAIIKGLYKSKTPNKYLAAFAPFLFKCESHPFIQRMLFNGINAFIENHVLKYRETLKEVPIHFVGSIAYYAQDYIKQALQERGIKAGKFVKSPMESIISQQTELS
ncbi:N-acetylglucosamine kinase [Tamlana fucoidanivorans]|uniref:N-acetylglucosamine kinase n=1 Tax=Allotamlana fucoidanivorans TaxID=2583814 RepID=A0A5C4SMC4_9FLAO|nr:N-acetylglucosamine kinase [Tamlana fucoidanivorans]TNJ45267.1 N-acetylglucosamine kinase [Tamlana fucoidanivorans]